MKLHLRQASKSFRDKRMYKKYLESSSENWLYLSENASVSTNYSDQHYFDGMDHELEAFFDDYIEYSVRAFDSSTNSLYFIELDEQPIGMITIIPAIKNTYRIAEWSLEKDFFDLRSDILDEVKRILKTRKTKNKTLCICTPMECAGNFLIEVGFKTDGDGFYYLNI